MRSSSRSDVDPFIVMDVVEAARKAEVRGRDIIHMEVGQPSTGLPKGALEVVSDAVGTDALGYTVSLGLPALREKVAQLYQTWYGIELDPNRVVITSGASGAFILAFTALFDSGQKVGLGEPGYPSYRQILHSLGLDPIGIQTTAKSRFQVAPNMVPKDLDGLIVASPGNPAGSMLSQDELGELISHSHAHDISFISDEIYHGLHYERPAISALNLSDDVYVINSFSKYFSMTGWRVGWMIVPPEHVRRVERLAQNMFICAPHISQVAALGAMECHQELSDNIKAYAQSRELMREGLVAAGFSDFAPPDGAFYIYVDASKYTDNSRALCDDMLEHAGIAVTPGLDFDSQRGHQTLRFSYACGPEKVSEGMGRLKDFMQARYK